MKKILFVLLGLSILLNACTQKKQDPIVGNVKILPNTMQLIDGNNAFGIKTFKLLNEELENGSNLLISPTSISLALAMTYNGANGDTKTAMEETLQMSGLTTQEINETFQSLMNDLTNLDSDVILKIANSIWYRNTFNVEQDFINTNIDYYNAQVNPLNFDDPGAKDIINNWVADETNNKIEEIVDQISPDHIMFLINAIYFNGKWQYQFDPQTTTDMTFTLEDGTMINHPFMSLKANLEVVGTNDIRGLRLPYGNDKYSMIFIQPNAGLTLDSLIGNLTNTAWNSWMNQFQVIQDLDIYIPKFTFEYEKELNKVLSDLGMGVAFSSSADFTGINPNGNLSISKVKHKTFIEVDEEGTEAAAVTSVGIVLTSAGGNSIHFNKPFLFAIVENATKTIVFIGKLSDPS